MKINTAKTLTTGISALLAVTSQAAVVATNTTFLNSGGIGPVDALTSSTDLADQSQSTFLSSTVTANTSGSTPETDFNDGVSALNFGAMTFFNGSGLYPAMVTLNLDVTTNTLGYDISEINSFAGWSNNVQQADQLMTVEYSVVGSAGFTSLGTFNNTSPGLGEYSQINLVDSSFLPFATGVDALKFTYAAPDSNRLVLQEIDVFGVATIPEPSRTILLGLGGLTFLLRRRRNRNL